VKRWQDFNKIQSLYPDQVATEILEVSLFDSVREDSLIWNVEVEHSGMHFVMED